MTNQLSKWIISASGWRTVFAKSCNEQDNTSEISLENAGLIYLAALSFSEYIKGKVGENSAVVLGCDSRPTGKIISYIFNEVMKENNIEVHYTGITAAPEIMVYARNYSGFVYVSASHNPIGHNGIKFGLSDGGVLEGSESAVLADKFRKLVAVKDSEANRQEFLGTVQKILANKAFENFSCTSEEKSQSLKSYFNFTKEVISGTENIQGQEKFFKELSLKIENNPITVLADMNGSARCISIDKDFLSYCGIGFEGMNCNVGEIAHEIIPEPENLVHVADFMTKLQAQGKKNAILAYMPDCDGDRGNIVFWNDKNQCAEILKAQEVFALCVMSELASLRYEEEVSKLPKRKIAVAVNDPTSMRIDAIANFFDAEVFRAEVGEANVVNLARKLRNEGYIVRILGEGSNGGNITHPAAVRDPINTLFSLIKLIAMPELFKLWCDVSGQNNVFKTDISLREIQNTLPIYTTTGVTDKRALLHIHTADHSALKAAYQSVLELQWQNVGASFMADYGIMSYEAVSNNGINETRNLKDFTKSAKGGLKLLLKDTGGNPIAFVWMRGSGTEPVFRVMCDVKGDNPELEKALLAWHTKMIEDADAFA